MVFSIGEAGASTHGRVHSFLYPIPFVSVYYQPHRFIYTCLLHQSIDPSTQPSIHPIYCDIFSMVSQSESKFKQPLPLSHSSHQSSHQLPSLQSPPPPYISYIYPQIRTNQSSPKYLPFHSSSFFSIFMFSSHEKLP